MAKASSTEFKASNGLRITTPAIIAGVAYLIIAILLLTPVPLYTYDPDTNKYVREKYDFVYRLLLVLLLLFPYLLSIYSLNCMMVGGCEVWSWIVGIVTIIWSLVVLTYAVYHRRLRLDDTLP